jgi:Zn-finger nucleic acid-binding protein
MAGTYLGPVHAHLCPECAGVFFGRGTLSELLRSHHLEYLGPQIEALNASIPKVEARAECPVCFGGLPLTRHRPEKLAGVAIDVCKRCGGTWVDGVEFKRLVRFYTKGRNVFTRLWDTIEFVLGTARKS